MTDKDKILNHANTHVSQINGLLKSYKSNINIDYIRELWNGITITTNIVVASSDLTFIEKYSKGLDNLESKDILPCLPQSKLFLKILGVPYFGNNLSASISVTQVEDTFSKTCMFNNITLLSCPRIIYTSKNSNMSVIWVNIWDSQNSTKAKTLINRSFNFGRYIVTVRDTSMNPGIPQCHNCWKWDHTTFACCAHGTKCQKCEGPHKLEHHRDMA